MQILIDIDENVFTRLFDNGVEDYAIVNDDLFAIVKSVRNCTPLPEHYGRLIDADKTLAIAWHKFWKQEEEHEKTIEGYDILRDRFYEQEGFECCQQTIVNAETIISATKEGAE